MRKNHYAKNELCQQKSQSHIGKLLDHGLECKFCDESFGFKEDLIGHMRTHSINTIQNKGNFSVPIQGLCTRIYLDSRVLRPNIIPRP